jgi:hypothetical protein
MQRLEPDLPVSGKLDIQLILAAQEGTPDTSLDDVVATRLLNADQMAAWVSHGDIVPMAPTN